MEPDLLLLEMDLQVQSLTTKGRATRQRIVEGAADAIRVRGVLTITLDDIMARTRVSKSQLFHYFPEGKDQLLLAVALQVLDDQAPHLSELNSWAWERWRDVVVERYRLQGQDCPIAVLTSQIGRSTPGAQAVATELLLKWHRAIAAGIREMQSIGEIDPQLQADLRAAAPLAAIQGGPGRRRPAGHAADSGCACPRGNATVGARISSVIELAGALH